MKTVLLDKLPTGKDRIISLPRRVINSVVYPAKTIVRKFRRKVICSGSPMNSIDFKMRKKHSRKAGSQVVKYYEVK